jgi:IS5 family transposase
LEEFARLPDESTILRFRHRLEKHKLAEQILVPVNELLTQRGLRLKAGTAVDAALIAIPTSTKNTAQLFTLFALFALFNLWRVRNKLTGLGA